MAVFSLKVNGHNHTVDVDADTPLLYVLSDELQLARPQVRLRPRASAAPAPSFCAAKPFARA